MPKLVKRRLWIGMAVIGIAGLAAIWTARFIADDPVYQGKRLHTLSLQAYARDERAEAALKAMGKRAVPGLTRLLQTKDSALRKWIWALQPRLPRRLGLLVLRKVGRPNAVMVREAAAQSLGIIGPEAKSAVVPLARALRDKEGRVWWEVAIALGRIGKESGRGLIEALRDRDDRVRHTAGD